MLVSVSQTLLCFSRWVVSKSLRLHGLQFCQAPLSTGFPIQENWSGLPFPSPVDLPDPGTEPTSALADGFFIAEPPVKSLCFHKVTLKPKLTQLLTLPRFFPSSGTSIVWCSSNPKVATVNQSGKVTAKKAGKATITACCGYASVSCEVTVTKNQWNYLLERYKSNSKVKQLIFVKYKGNSRARVVLYQKKAGIWKKTLSCMGNVGKNGIGKKMEGDKKTPTGTFNLPMAFGLEENPGTKLSYTKVKWYHYWCSDKSYYNQLIDIRSHGHNCSGEHLTAYKGYYDYGVFIDYDLSES